MARIGIPSRWEDSAVTQVPLFDAKNRLSALVHDAESGSPVELTRHGKPVAVVLGREAYDRLHEEHRMFGRLFDRFLREWPLSPDERQRRSAEGDPFAAVRSREPGRDVDL